MTEIALLQQGVLGIEAAFNACRSDRHRSRLQRRRDAESYVQDVCTDETGMRKSCK